ncbi:unnamed protein product [Rotaria socialis]|uniref:Integrase catalytic domain-containing protein n=1 Tax=Rotaria socialis TaxID=392032 RepID=A0A817UZD8_9BILA|nr:unnamed protein product [Rotaria socialis]CAF3339770.1 unnamed protein product [Rotaria socialis]CAF4562111.1 unnamed protein product [Rotaria socialis]CAF4579317.1 unnamed protein product [Rotaria socialis]
MYENILLVLRDSCGDAQFKYWAQKHFTLVKIGDSNVVYSRGKVSRPVMIYEELYTKLHESHSRVGHHGRDKTWEEVKCQYSCTPYDAVMIFIKLCDACSNRQIFPKPPVGKPIISVSYLTRIQMDLIDMRSRPDGKFKWILHVKDHFTKFSWAYPLETKEAEPVAEKLLQQFYAFGAPHILQSDNGKEFVARIIKDMRKTCTDFVIINGRARHPQTQGLIERGNHTLEMGLGKWMKHNHTDCWASGLGPVVYSINTSIAKMTSKTPYEVVFGQASRSNFEMWKIISESGVEDEENLPDDFIEALTELHQCDTSNSDTSNSNDFGKNNQLHVIDANNQLLLRTPQSPASSCIPDTIIVANTLEKILEVISMNCSRSLFDLAYNALSQDVSNINNSENNPNLITNTPNSRHKTIRDEAEVNYLKSIAKKQKLYDDVVKQQKYELGDLVGLHIDRVDRTNTTPKILPCKVIFIHTSANNYAMYKLCTLKGILSVSYGVQDLLDLRNSDFADLRHVDATALPTIAFTQACKEYLSVGINPIAEACNCNGKCATKYCPCKAKRVKCCTKCHPKKKNTCENTL